MGAFSLLIISIAATSQTVYERHYIINSSAGRIYYKDSLLLKSDSTFLLYIFEINPVTNDYHESIKSTGRWEKVKKVIHLKYSSLENTDDGKKMFLIKKRNKLWYCNPKTHKKYKSTPFHQTFSHNPTSI